MVFKILSRCADMSHLTPLCQHESKPNVILSQSYRELHTCGASALCCMIITEATEQHLPQSEAVPVIVVESDLKSWGWSSDTIKTSVDQSFAIKAACKDRFSEEEELGENEADLTVWHLSALR